MGFLFFVMPLLGIAYVSWHSWQILPFPTWGKSVVMALFAVAVGCLFFNFSVGLDNVPMPLARVIYAVGTSTIFVLLYAVILFAVLDLGRVVGLVPRSFLHSSLTGSVVVVALLAAVFTYGNVHYHHKYRRHICLKAESPLASPLKVVMMSDLHLGYHNTRSDLARWVDIVNGEHPDLVLIAGDVVDISVRPLYEDSMASELRRIKAPVYACPGNHEYYAGIERSESFFRKAGIKMLRDSSVVFGNALTIVGRDDRTERRRKSVASLVAAAPKSKYTILLDHQPYNLDRSAKAGVDFQFSGHTHHGQVWPVSWIEDAIYEDAYGPLTKGRTRFYVSSGMGIWGGKFRIGTYSEYLVAEIR